MAYLCIKSLYVYTPLDVRRRGITSVPKLFILITTFQNMKKNIFVSMNLILVRGPLIPPLIKLDIDTPDV